MKTAIIVHGWDGKPDTGWFVWIESELKKQGYKVIKPSMPNPQVPKIDTWVKKLFEVSKDADEETIFIGHSIGCQTILRFLESAEIKKVKGVFFVAPWLTLKEETYSDPESGEESRKIAKPWITKKIDFDKIKNKTKKVVCIFSDNDPFVALSNSNIFMDRLNAKIIVQKNKGHFEEDKTNKMPILLEEVSNVEKMPVIHKVIAIVIEDNKLLMVRKKGKDIWTGLGGKPEVGETEEQALLREIDEEVHCKAKILRKLGDTESKAAFDDAIVKLSAYLVELKGKIKLDDPELQECKFIPENYNELGIKLTSSMEEQRIPQLIDLGLLKWKKKKNNSLEQNKQGEIKMEKKKTEKKIEVKKQPSVVSKKTDYKLSAKPQETKPAVKPAVKSAVQPVVQPTVKKHELPKLPYAYNTLEPYMDEATVKLHHDKHHQTYVDNLNLALDKYPELYALELGKLLSDLNKVPEDIRLQVRNHGGGVWNHNMFWEILKKDVKVPKEIAEAINKDLGGMDKFKEEFKKAALGQFGSGWAWLVLNKGKLEITKLPNQDSPLSAGMVPLLTIDVWEHSYYLKYQNRRAEYVDNFFNIINWEEVNKRYLVAKKK